MATFKTRTEVTSGGAIQIDGLPFAAGEQVEVVVKPLPAQPPAGQREAERYPLRGLVNPETFHYERPFDPAVPPEDWAALQ